MALENVISKFSILSVNYADQCTNELIRVMDSDNDCSESLDRINKFRINKLFLFFIIHFIDRLAFQNLKLEQRSELMDSYGFETIKTFVSLASDPEQSLPKEDIFLKYLEELNSFSLRYNKYAFIPDNGDDNPKGTILWEFSKEITFMATKSYDITYIMSITNMMMLVIYERINVLESLKQL